MKKFLILWVPVLLWMALIFTGSSDAHSSEHSSRFFEPLLRWLFPKMSQPHIDDLHLVIRKCGHLTEYAILALLVWRALHRVANNLPAWSWPKVGGTLLVVFLYAVSDEFHQSFVPTRTAHFSDVLIDVTGAVIALLVLRLLTLYRKRGRSSQK